MCFRAHVGVISLRGLPGRVEQEGHTISQPPVAQHAQGRRGCSALVGQEWEGWAMFVLEALVGVGAIQGNSVDLHPQPLVTVHPVSEGACLFRTVGSVVLGVEV